MKTWEMLKELTENPKAKFESYHGRVVAISDKTGRVVWLEENGEEAPFIIFSYGPGGVDNLHIEWKLVPQEVDFTTAVNAFNNMVTIECSFLGIGEKRVYKPSVNRMRAMLDQHGTAVTSDEILNGKWYIK